MSQIVEINGDISTKFERGPGSSLPAHGFMLCLCFIEIFNWKWHVITHRLISLGRRRYAHTVLSASMGAEAEREEANSHSTSRIYTTLCCMCRSEHPWVNFGILTETVWRRLWVQQEKGVQRWAFSPEYSPGLAVTGPDKEKRQLSLACPPVGCGRLCHWPSIAMAAWHTRGDGRQPGMRSRRARSLIMQDSITESKTINYILFMVFCWCGSIFIEERGRKNKTPSLI